VIIGLRPATGAQRKEKLMLSGVLSLMLRATACLLVILVIVGAGSARLMAQTNEWPSQMNLGGFSITGIRGSVNPDGSGTATGTLDLPGVSGPKQVSLTRSSRGDVSGAVQISFRAFNCELQGSFTIDGSGMRGKGTIRTPARPVQDATFSVLPNGRFNGSGKMDIGAGMPVKFTFSASSLDITGSASVKTQSDTPLATYSFTGDVRLAIGGARVAITAKGTVQRSGKLSDQISTYTVSNVDVNPSDGTGRANIDGVNVMFDFFRR